jgi:hypothetical protein
MQLTDLAMQAALCLTGRISPTDSACDFQLLVAGGFDVIE